MEYGEELTRVVDVLRSMPIAKLSRPVESGFGSALNETRSHRGDGDGPRGGGERDVTEPGLPEESVRDQAVTRADGSRALAQWLADAGARAEGRPLRTVPDVGDVAVGDQIAVTGADLLRADPGPEVLAEATERLRALRLAL